MSALLVLLVVTGAWEAYARLSGVEQFLLPAPSEVATALFDDRALLWSNLTVTAGEIAIGLGAAMALGLLSATALHFAPRVRRGAYPLLVASQTVPIPIVSPLLVVWFGFSLAPKIAIIALVCFFPILVPTLDALGRVDADLRTLMRSFGATRWQTFRIVEAPAALPGLFTGAKLSVAVATIAAVLAEQSGSENGLGRLVLQALPQFETPRAYAAVFLLCVFAVLLFWLLALAERRLVPWSVQQRGTAP